MYQNNKLLYGWFHHFMYRSLFYNRNQSSGPAATSTENNAGPGNDLWIRLVCASLRQSTKANPNPFVKRLHIITLFALKPFVTGRLAAAPCGTAPDCWPAAPPLQLNPWLNHSALSFLLVFAAQRAKTSRQKQVCVCWSCAREQIENNGRRGSLTSTKSARAGMYPAMSLESKESKVGRGGSSAAKKHTGFCLRRAWGLF